MRSAGPDRRPETWGQQVFTFADNCVQTTTTFDSCNIAREGSDGSAPVALGPGQYGNAEIYDEIDLSGSGAYGVLHGSASGSLSISGAGATIWAYGGASFGDTLTISDAALAGQTGHLRMGYELNGTITSSGADQGSILVVGDHGGVGAVGATYSANVHTASVNGNFLLPKTFTFTYGQPFTFGLGIYAAVDSNGVPAKDATFSSAPGTACGYNGVTPEPLTKALLAAPLLALVLFWSKQNNPFSRNLYRKGEA